MKNPQMIKRRASCGFGYFVLTFLLGATIVVTASSDIRAQAQGATTPPVGKETLSGKYEGTAKTNGGPDDAVTMELKDESGKVTGHATHGQTTLEISEGSLKEGNLVLKFAGRDGVLTAKFEGEKITGEWVAGNQKRAVEFKKVAPQAAAVTTEVNLTGEWDAVADAQGQPFPFQLILKVEGDKVSGTSSSQLGDSTITGGTWKDGQLSFQLDSANATVVMSATLVEGKLTGVFDYSGQMQGKWVAIKKK